MTWFYNLKTSTKLVISFGLMLAMLMVVAWEGNVASSAMRENQQATFNVDLKSVKLTGTVERLRVLSGRLTRDGIIESDPAVVEKVKQERAANDAELLRGLDQLEKMTSDEGSRREIAAFRSGASEWERLSEEAVDNSPIGDSKGNPVKMMAALHRMNELGIVLDGHIAAVNEQVMRSAGERAANSDDEFERSQVVAIGMSVGVLLLGCFLTFLITRAIAKPLQASVAVLERVSGGDLTARLIHESKDEIGQLAVALNASLESIQDTLVGVQSIAAEVSTASSELASSAQQISSGAQEQAASLEETAASLEEISSTVKQNTDSAQQASQLSNGARDAAERGGRVVESAVSAMTEITKSSKKIAEIITTIDEIAFQTNLLALNAAVEAARAGEQGRGFGVVAAEVRLLAQRTATAAKEIRGLIADSTSKVEVGTDQVNQSGETLVEIVRSVKRVTDMVAEIAAASREQTTGIDQVNTAVTQVDQVTQLNAAQTEELSATANALSDKAADLRQQVARFQLGTTAGMARTPVVAERTKVNNVTKLRIARAIPAKAAPALKAASGYEEF